MRKKIFATLMSVAMVASFMPSLAFAAVGHTHAYAVTVNDGTATWASIKVAMNLPQGALINLVKAPTCTEDGEAVLTCSKQDCDTAYTGHTVTVTIPANHTTEVKRFSAKELADQLYSQDANGWGKKACAAFVAADAKDKTYCYYNADYCTVCNKIVGKIPAPSSITTSSNVVQAVDHQRVATTGCNTKDKCLECGTLVAVSNPDKVVEHTPSTTEWVKVKDATCTERAKKARPCTVCGEPVESTIVDDDTTEVLGHNLAHAQVTEKEATNSDGSLKAGYFKVTGCVLDSFGNTGDKYYKATDATGTEGAATNTNCPADKMGVKCATCGKFVNFGTGHVISYKDLNGDNGTKKVNELDETATYNSTGAKHDFAVVKEVAATCARNAYTVKECKLCDKRVEVEKPNTQLKHEYKVTEVKGDCVSAGKVVISCKNCDRKETVTPAVLNAVTAAGNTMFVKVGDKYYFKGFDGKLTSFIELPAIKTGNGAHKWEPFALYKEATCEHGEIWGRKCKNCDKLDPSTLTYKGVALKHNFEKVQVAATCGAPGYYAEKCTLCNKFKAVNGTITATKIEDAAHFETSKPVVKKDAKCTVDKWIVTKEATVFDEGVKTLGCSVCGKIEDNAPKTVVEKKKVGTPVVMLTSTKGRMTVKASAADNATGYKVTYKRAGKKAVTKTYTAEQISKTYRLLKGKKYTVTVTAFASNGTDTVNGGTVTKTITIKK